MNRKLRTLTATNSQHARDNLINPFWRRSIVADCEHWNDVIVCLPHRNDIPQGESKDNLEDVSPIAGVSLNINMGTDRKKKSTPPQL